MTSAIRRLRLAAGLASSLCAATALADTTPQSLPFTQDWSDGTMLTTTNVWTGVPGIVGHRGDGLASAGADPQTVLAPDDTASSTLLVMAVFAGMLRRKPGLRAGRGERIHNGRKA